MSLRWCIVLAVNISVHSEFHFDLRYSPVKSQGGRSKHDLNSLDSEMVKLSRFCYESEL